MNDVIKHILLHSNIKTILNLRQSCKYIDTLLHFNFWINKFKYDNMMIMALKLPSNVKDWIKEYINVKKVYIEIKSIFSQDYVRLNIDKQDYFYKYNSFLTKENITTLLPKSYRIVDTPTFGFIMDIKRKKLTFTGWRPYRNRNIDNKKDKLEIKLFIQRLLYYYPNVYLTNEKYQSIRKNAALYYIHQRALND